MSPQPGPAHTRSNARKLAELETFFDPNIAAIYLPNRY
jgi:hypothetical protein